jgi:hypothetical protein
VETQGLQRAEVNLSPAGDPDPVSGKKNRNRARMRRQRWGVNCHSLPNGVPSKGIRKLIGTESGSTCVQQLGRNEHKGVVMT